MNTENAKTLGTVHTLCLQDRKMNIITSIYVDKVDIQLKHGSNMF